MYQTIPVVRPALKRPREPGLRRQLMARSPHTPGPEHNRTMLRVEVAIASVTERLEHFADTLNQRVDDVVQQVEQMGDRHDADRKKALAEFAALRDVTAELRDMANSLRQQAPISTTPAALEAVAKGSAEGAKGSNLFSTWQGRAVAVAAGIAAATGSIEGLPKIINFTAGLIKFLGGLDK